MSQPTAEQIQSQIDVQNAHQLMHITVNLVEARNKLNKQAKKSETVSNALDHTIVNMCAAMDRIVERDKPQAH